MLIYKKHYNNKKYLESFVGRDINEFIPLFNSLIRKLNKWVPLQKGIKILEVGCGTGWLLILFKLNGFECVGLEISQDNANFAIQWSKKYGVNLHIIVDSIENYCENGKYDIIIANSVFEHVKDWQKGLKNVYMSLKKGGLFYFTSTNKFSFKQGEFNFPLYSWLPDNFRYKLRTFLQGEEIMRFGIDYNQFTYFQLRKVFKDLGYNKIMDIIDFYEVSDLKNPTLLKRCAIHFGKKNYFIKNLILLFAPVTEFICIK